MEAYQLRVVEEKSELDGKLEKLRNFLVSDAFDKLEDAEQSRLFRQAEIMGEYSGVLQERISAFD